jgi:uroporphyrinogen-III decarboxylase
MVQAYKEAGAAKVYMHCDGNVMSLVEMWVDAGIEAIHPCEHRAGVDLFALRRKHGERLAYIGAMDNCHILPQGSRDEIENHVRELAEFGRDGGLVLGGHSIGPDISIERYEWAMASRREYGTYRALTSDP